MGIVEAWELFTDGEISLDALGEALREEGYDPREIREMLSSETKYPIPVNYFGMEEGPRNQHVAEQLRSIVNAFSPHVPK